MMESATLELSEKQLNEIVELTFSMASKHPNRMSYGMSRPTLVFQRYIAIVTDSGCVDEYFTMISENPALLSSLRVDLHRVMTTNKNGTIQLLEGIRFELHIEQYVEYGFEL